MVTLILGGIFLFSLVLFGGLATQKELKEKELADPEYKASVEKLNKKKC
jgi:hypothetical protein